MKIDIDAKRVYDARTDQPAHGYRVLVDRIWPRGLSRESVHYDLWCKELAPSTELRKWFGHKKERWDDFKSRYQSELRSEDQTARIKDLLKNANSTRLTLLYGAKDTEHNHALVLADEISRVAKSVRKPRSTNKHDDT